MTYEGMKKSIKENVRSKAAEDAKHSLSVCSTCRHKVNHRHSFSWRFTTRRSYALIWIFYCWLPLCLAYLAWKDLLWSKQTIMAVFTRQNTCPSTTPGHSEEIRLLLRFLCSLQSHGDKIEMNMSRLPNGFDQATTCFCSDDIIVKSTILFRVN